MDFQLGNTVQLTSGQFGVIKSIDEAKNKLEITFDNGQTRMIPTSLIESKIQLPNECSKSMDDIEIPKQKPITKETKQIAKATRIAGLVLDLEKLNETIKEKKSLLDGLRKELSNLENMESNAIKMVKDMDKRHPTLCEPAIVAQLENQPEFFGYLRKEMD